MSRVDPGHDEGHRRVRAPAIVTPVWDGLLTGAISLVGMGVILLWLLVGGEVAFIEADWLALTILINSPHFLASYRILYTSSRAELRKHAWSTLYVPGMLVAILVWCVVAPRPDAIVQWLVLLSSIYLAWHYTGQAWGMVASFSLLSGVRYSDRERRLIRLGPRCLLVLHVLFALAGRLPPTYADLYTGVLVGTCGAIGLSVFAGGWGFFAARRRGEPIPVRAVLPWASLYVWYPFWYFVPGGFLWVQLSHALQYLAFPLRVEVNRYAAVAPRSEWQRRLRVVLVYVGLVLVGAVVLNGLPLAAHAFGEGWYSGARARVLLLALTSCVGIHHYFVDGALWRLHKPEVRKALFSHLDR